MPINAPVIVSVVEVGSPVAYLRVTWDHDITGSPATDGYLIEWDYDNPAWNPSWIVPPAVDLGLLDGNGATPVRRYTVLVNLANAFVSDWETFEEYVEGDHSVLAYGGSKWAGPAVAIETYIGYKGFGDDFESYAVGLHSELGAGKGWAAPAEAIGMGDFEIVKRTISSVDDQRVVVDNTKSPWVRTMAIGDDWTKIRVGVRISTLRDSAWSGAPFMYFGLCAGTSSPPGSVSPNHFVGTKLVSNWTNPNIYFISFGTGASRPTIIASGIETQVASNSSDDIICHKSSQAQSGIFLEITKGSPNWTIDGRWTINSAPTTLTESYFKDLMQIGSLPVDTMFGANSVSGSTKTFTAPDEGTYGALDSVCFVFLGSSDGFEISDIDYARLA